MKLRRDAHVAYLRFGHGTAFVCLLVTASASRFSDYVALPLHAAPVYMCAILLRIALLRFQRAPQLTKLHYDAALFLALSAAATFVTSALHVVATRVYPDALLPLIGSTALDISALWMRMAATVKSPSRSAYPALFFLIYAASDLCLAARIAAVPPATYLLPALACRALLNCCRLAAASRTILQWDENRKKLSR